MRKIKPLLLILIIAGLTGCAYIGGGNYARLRESSSIISKDFFVEQDFKFNFHLIVIPVTIEGKTYEFIFDTGASNSIISREAADALGLVTKTSITTRDSRNNRKKMSVGVIDTMTIGGVHFKDISANIVDWPENSAVECIGKDGLIGNNLIRNCNWIVDYERKVLILTDNELPHEEMVHSTPMLYANSRPKFDLTLDGKNIRSVLLDLGSGGSLDVGKNLQTKYKIDINTYENVKKLDGTSQGLFGASLDSTTIIKADSISIGSYTVYQPPVDIESKSGAKIGNRFLKHSLLYLDYDYNVLGFSPYKDSSIYPISKTFGLSISLNNDGLYVGSINVNSEADKQGIKQGDKVLEMNGKTPKDFPDYCSYLDYLRNEVKGSKEMILVFTNNPNKEIVFKATPLWKEN